MKDTEGQVKEGEAEMKEGEEVIIPKEGEPSS